jgi:hypothetical protein
MTRTAFWQHKMAPVRFVLHTRTTSLGSRSISGSVRVEGPYER